MAAHPLKKHEHHLVISPDEELHFGHCSARVVECRPSENAVIFDIRYWGERWPSHPVRIDEMIVSDGKSVAPVKVRGGCATVQISHPEETVYGLWPDIEEANQ